MPLYPGGKFKGNVSLDGHRITDLDDPVDDDDAISKGWALANTVTGPTGPTGAGFKEYVTVGPDAGCDYVTNGDADDVQINAAIDFVSSNGTGVGGKVVLMAANYDIDAAITIHPFVTLEGVNCPWNDQGWAFTKFNSSQVQCARFLISSDRTTIYPVQMEASSCIQNVQFYYPDQETNDTPVAYYAAIKLVARATEPGLSAWASGVGYVYGDKKTNDGATYFCIHNHTSGASTEPGTGAGWNAEWYLYEYHPSRCKIENVDFYNSYYAVDATEYHDSLTVTDCIGWPLYRGIYEDDNWDISRFTRIHFNPGLAGILGATLTAWVFANGIAFDFRHSDTSTMTDCMAFGYKHGLYLLGNNAMHCTNCAFDAMKYPLYMDTCTSVTINNCWFISYQWYDASQTSSNLAEVTGCSYCNISDSYFGAGKNGLIILTGVANVISGNRFYFNSVNTVDANGIYCTSKRCVVQGNTFESQYEHTYAAQLDDADGSNFTGNEFYNCAHGVNLANTNNGIVFIGNSLISSGTVTDSTTNSEVAHNPVI